ncbi:F-box only protein 3 [Planoprotostelium fungivorum]|uniref:F-box only protein 3 n=1 Tax=Planoprotostelium fungivorum TaxID=1890364 RepID=A0A2P6N3A3_9EUKA|nr:F-box only protein 3 [Planoprotostelium fungivorum]
MSHTCTVCHKDARKFCGKCKQEWYCSRDCQIAAWKNHKDECPKLQEKAKRPELPKSDSFKGKNIGYGSEDNVSVWANIDDSNSTGDITQLRFMIVNGSNANIKIASKTTLLTVKDQALRKKVHSSDANKSQFVQHKDQEVNIDQLTLAPKEHAVLVNHFQRGDVRPDQFQLLELPFKMDGKGVIKLAVQVTVPASVAPTSATATSSSDTGGSNPCSVTSGTKFGDRGNTPTTHVFTSQTVMDIQPSHLLPELLENIFSRLDCESLGRVAAVNHHWREASGTNVLWKHWGIYIGDVPEELQSIERTHKDDYKSMYVAYLNSSFGRYKNHLVDVRKTVSSLTETIQKLGIHCGFTPAQLDRYEETVKLNLDDETRCLYRLIGDQTSEDGITCAGVFGGYEFYGTGCNMSLMGLRQSIKWTNRLSQAKIDFIRSLIPIAVDLDARKKFFYYSKHPSYPGAIIDVRHGDCILVADSLLSLMKKSIYNISSGNWLPIENGLITVFPTRLDMGATEAVTRGVRIRCSVVYVHEEVGSEQSPNFFSYRVQMSMDPTESPDRSCQLVSRHWSCIDCNGVVSHVEGPGVIGEYPIMKPGARFEYTSCTFQNGRGSMEGFFRMKSLTRHGEMFDVEVPRFSMEAPQVIFRVKVSALAVPVAPLTQ